MKTVLLLSLLLTCYSLNINSFCEIYTPTSCTQCVPTYILQTNTNTFTQYCALCSDLILGCLYCDVVGSVPTCTTCKKGYDLLINGSCIGCPPGGFFNVSSGQYQHCLIANCESCPLTSTLPCKRCYPGFYLSNASTTAGSSGQCVSLDIPITLNATTPVQLIQEYLLQVMPTFRQPVVNFEALGRVCTNNGYSCMCNDNSSTSRCTPFNRTLVQTVYNFINGSAVNQAFSRAYDWSVEAVNNLTTSAAEVLSKLGTLSTSITDTDTLRNMIQAISKLNYSANAAELTNLRLFLVNSVTQSLQNLVQSQEALVLTGNQYIFKMSKYDGTTSSISSNYSYDPVNVVYNQSVTGVDLQFMIFDRSALNDPFTGYLITWNNFATQPQANITIPYLSTLSPVNQYQLIDNLNATIEVSYLNMSNGVFTFPSSSVGILTVRSTPVMVIDAHARLRIQRLFYQSAILYILFFLLLYIIFIPLCTFFDFCNDDKTKKRKQYVVRDPTIQDFNSAEYNQPSAVDLENQAEINYKQFFPLYNIGATQNRPERITKLELYLLNLQNPTTFLVLLYIAVPQIAVWAILLAIPAYFLNIIAGYLYGMLKNLLPGRWKHTINIIPIGYWIIWYFLMPRFGIDFTLYVLIFSVILVVIDLIVDALQTMAMYFIIKEENPIYDCLAPILSKRGYFDYAKYSNS